MSGGREAGVNVSFALFFCALGVTLEKLHHREQFRGRQFFLEDMDGLGRAWVENGFGIVQAHYIYCAFYSY